MKRVTGPAPHAVRPPHLDRLVQRVLALDGPLVQLWAWPGAGQQAVLDALTEDARFGQPLSLDALADEAALGRAVDAAFAGGARWLVLPAVPSLPAASPEGAGAIARRLTPGRRLVFAAPEKRPPGPLACSYVLPTELLLGEEEVGRLWLDVTGAAPADDLVERLRRVTDGWYRPLRLAAEAAAEAGGSVDPSALVELPAVISFLRHEVLPMLAPDERELAVTLSAGRTLESELWAGLLSPEEETLRRRLVEVWGLAVERSGSLRLPNLLHWFLARDRRGRWSRQRRQRVAARLARVELAHDRPVSALEQLLEARRPADLERLFDVEWPRLLAAAPLGLLARLFEENPARPGEPAGMALARGLTEALLWRRPEALPTAAAGDAEAVAATARVAAELLGEEPPAGPEGLEPWRALPPALRPLAVLHELEDEPDPAAGPEGDGEAPESDDAAVAALLVPALERVEAAARPLRDGSVARPQRSAAESLFEHGLLALLRRRPGLDAVLSRRRDLPPAWRSWLAGLPAPALGGAAPGYTVALLGKPAVRLRRLDGRSTELRFPLRRSLEVLGFLATAPGFTASRAELVEAVWPDADEATVEKNLHPTLSYLRRSLGAPSGRDGSTVLLRRGVYRLNPRLTWNVDAVEMVRRVEEGHRRLREGQPEQAAELWRSGWALYGGPLLEGWDAPWVVEKRDALSRAYLDLLRSLGEVDERLGELTEAQDAFRAALLADPLQEPVHLALMRLYARQGRRDHVRRQYQRLVSLLADELGVEPLPGTTETYHRLMS